LDKSVLEEYINQFEVFESEVNYGFKNICLHYSINILTIGREAPLNTTPEFWNNTIFNLTTVAILTLGRIFDLDAKFSVHKLLNILGQNIEILSLTELRTRKENIDFEEYVEGKVDFNKEMYRELVNRKKTLLKQYESTYKVYRNSIIGHRLVKNLVEIDTNNEFKYMDILNMYIALYNLKRELWERYHNGRGTKNLTFEKLTSQIYSLEKSEDRTPIYLHMARDYLKIYNLLKEHG